MALPTRSSAGPLPAGVDQARTRLVPAWLRGGAAIGWRVLVAVALGAVLAQVAIALSTAVLAVVVGVVIAATFSPLVRALRARGWTRARAAAVASVMSLVSVLVAALLIVLAFVPYLGDVAALAGEGTARIEAELRNLGIPPSVVEALGRATAQLEASAPDAARSLVGPVGTLVTVLILGGFLTFYLLEDADRAWANLTAKLDPWQTDTLDARAVAATAQVGAYLRAMALTAAITGVTQAIYLFVLGVPFAGPLAVFVFVGAFVPYLGAIVTTVVLLLITLVTAGGGAALALLALIGATAIARRRLLARRVYAGATRVHPALVLVVAPAGAALFGLAGLLLAVPVAAAVIAFAPAIVTVLGNPPGTPPQHAFVPAWLDRIAQWGWRVLVIVAVLAVAAQTLVAPILTAPVVVALVVACASKPAFDAVRTRGLGPTAAALTVTLASALIVVTILVVTVASLAQQLPAILDEAIAGAGQIVGGASLTEVLETVQGTLLDASRAVLENLASISLALVSAALLTFFFVRDGPGWWAALLDHVPAAHRRELGESGASAARILNGSTFGTGDRLRHRRCAAVRDDDRPRAPARIPDRRPDVLRGLHPVHRWVHRERGRVPRCGRRGRPDHSRADGGPHRRQQHPDRELRRASRPRPDRPRPPGRRVARGPGRRGDRRPRRDVPDRPVDRDLRGDLAIHRQPVRSRGWDHSGAWSRPARDIDDRHRTAPAAMAAGAGGVGPEAAG